MGWSLNECAIEYFWNCVTFPEYEEIHRRQYLRMVILVLTGELVESVERGHVLPSCGGIR